jgi:hypothetical protein
MLARNTKVWGRILRMIGLNLACSNNNNDDGDEYDDEKASSIE